MTKRREFIKNSVIGTAGIAVGGMGFSSKSYASIIGANERINIAVIGFKGRGGAHVNSFASMKDTKNVIVKTLCDADEQFFAQRIKAVQDRSGITPKTEWDMRKVFEDKDIHAVSFGTPNHWHALGTIWALQAGKHVYVEKPVSHNVQEGRKMIEASRKYNLRVQSGHNGRSSINILKRLNFCMTEV